MCVLRNVVGVAVELQKEGKVKAHLNHSYRKEQLIENLHSSYNGSINTELMVLIKLN